MALTDTNSHPPDPKLGVFTEPASVGGSYVDSVFGEKVIRITDAVSEGKAFLVHEYASQDPMNSDGTMLRLTNPTGGTVFLDTSDWSLIRTKAIGSSTTSDYWWSKTDPDVLYNMKLSGNPEMRSYDYGTDTNSTLVNFNSLDANLTQVSGKGENELSNDGNRIALAGGTGNTNTYVFVYQFSTNDIIAILDLPANDPFDGVTVSSIGDVHISGDGTRVIVTANSGDVLIFSVNEGGGTLDFEWKVSVIIGHHDSATGPDGKDYLFGVDSVSNNNMWRVEVGAATETKQNFSSAGVWPGNVGGVPFRQALHVSCRALQQTGYVYVSLYTTSNPDPDVDGWLEYVQEIVRAPYDQSGNIERLCHHRTVATEYYKYPRAAVDTNGTYCFFSSDYQDGTAGYSETWAIELTAPPPEDGTYRLRLS